MTTARLIPTKLNPASAVVECLILTRTMTELWTAMISVPMIPATPVCLNAATGFVMGAARTVRIAPKIAAKGSSPASLQTVIAVVMASARGPRMHPLAE
jgi:hypothetical protein